MQKGKIIAVNDGDGFIISTNLLVEVEGHKFVLYGDKVSEMVKLFRDDMIIRFDRLPAPSHISIDLEDNDAPIPGMIKAKIAATDGKTWAVVLPDADPCHHGYMLRGDSIEKQGSRLAIGKRIHFDCHPEPNCVLLETAKVEDDRLPGKLPMPPDSKTSRVRIISDIRTGLRINLDDGTEFLHEGANLAMVYPGLRVGDEVMYRVDNGNPFVLKAPFLTDEQQHKEGWLVVAVYITKRLSRREPELHTFEDTIVSLVYRDGRRINIYRNHHFALASNFGVALAGQMGVPYRTWATNT